jgi:WD40 repeat protein
VGGDRVLRSWDLASGRQSGAVKLQGTASPGTCVTFSPDGNKLAAFDQQQQKVVLWEVASGKELKTRPGPKDQIGYLCFSPDGKELAVGDAGPQLSLWAWESGKERRLTVPVRKIGLDSTFHGYYSAGGKWLVTGGGWAEPLVVFEAATGRKAHTLRCDASTSAVSRDDKLLAVVCMKNDKGGQEPVVLLFDLASGKEVARYPQGEQGYSFALAFSPDGKALACGFQERGRVLDVATGRTLLELPAYMNFLAFSPDGKTLAATAGARLRCWDVATGKELHDRPGDLGYTPVAAVSPDGRLLASSHGFSAEVSLWDAASGRLLRQLAPKGEKQYPRDLAFTRDSQTVVACQPTGVVQSWEAATGKGPRVTTLNAPGPTLGGRTLHSRFHVSGDGKQVSALERPLETANITRMALWETGKGDVLHGHEVAERVEDAAWLANGTVVALPLKQGLELIDLRTGAVQFRVAAPKGDGSANPAASPEGAWSWRARAPPWAPGKRSLGAR